VGFSKKSLCSEKFLTAPHENLKFKSKMGSTHCLRKNHYVKKIRGFGGQWNQALMTNWLLWQLKKSKSWDPFWTYYLNCPVKEANSHKK